MKNLYIVLSLIIAMALLLVPLTATAPKSNVVEASVDVTLPTKTIKVKDAETGEISDMDIKEYLFCVVSAEMPALYHEEALKAQTVAAYTYALYKSEINKNEEYDITNSHKTDQAFKPRNQAVAAWGENAKEYEKKIDDAIEAVFGQALCYNNEIILCLYTAISSGKTESSEVAFGKKLPYLVPKESIGDMLSPDYLSTVTISKDEVANKLAEKGISTDFKSWFASPKKSDSGTVLEMSFGDKTLSGSDIRTLFGLRSPNFQVELKEETFTFTVRGYGHLCGMSQYGANYMAMQGSSYKDILLWYYTDCEIVSTK